MHRVLAVLAMAAFAAEEFRYRRTKRRDRLPSFAATEGEGRQAMDAFDILRLLELLFITLILSTPGGNLAGTHGQIALILAGLQLARLFGRRILSTWSVLGVLHSIEAFFLAVFLFLPTTTDTVPRLIITPAAAMALTGGGLYMVLITLCASFAISYWVKYFAVEHTGLFRAFPPLAYSESWAVRLSRNTILPGIAGLSGILILSGFSAMPVLLGLSIIIQTAGLLVVSRLKTVDHHPLAHVLWTVSFLLVTGMLFFGVTALPIAG